MVDINRRTAEEVDFQRLFFVADPLCQTLRIQRLLNGAFNQDTPTVFYSRFTQLLIDSRTLFCIDMTIAFAAKPARGSGVQSAHPPAYFARQTAAHPDAPCGLYLCICSITRCQPPRRHQRAAHWYRIWSTICARIYWLPVTPPVRLMRREPAICSVPDRPKKTRKILLPKKRLQLIQPVSHFAPQILTINYHSVPEGMSGSVYCSKRCANTVLLRQILCAARFAINLHLIANIRTFAAHGKWYRPLPVFADNVLWINPCNGIELSQFF